MGWLFGWSSRKQMIEHLTETTTNGSSTWQTLAQTYRGTPWQGVLWAVQQHNADDPFIIAYLCHYRSGDWGYKPISESMGPVEVGCPLKYLAMAPCEDGAWRERVAAYWAKLNAKRQATVERRKAMGWYA